jgi:hypothetical protein
MNYKLTSLFFLITLFFLYACEEDYYSYEDIRDGVTGEWLANENSTIFGNTSYSISISKVPNDSSAIWVENFYDLEGNVRVTLNRRNLTIPQQVVAGHTISGYGLITFDFKRVEFSYSVKWSTGEEDEVYTVCTRF